MTRIDPKAAPRFQFTMRTYFVAAILISLFAAALGARDASPSVIGFAALVWSAFFVFYRLSYEADRECALLVGTIISGVLWLAFQPMVFGSQAPDAWIALPAAFGWGIFFSIFVRFARSLRGLFAGPAMRAKPELVMACCVVLARILLSSVLFILAVLFAMQTDSPGNVPKHVPAEICLYVDTPLIPLVVGVLYPDPPTTSTGFILFMMSLNCPLYAVAGWFVGYNLAFENRRVGADLRTNRSLANSPASREILESSEQPSD